MNQIASVVLCTRNRSNLLKRTLDALNNQTLGPNEYEIIVVDDCSNDNTALVCKNLTNKIPNMKFIRSETHSFLSSARNMGIEHSKGDVVLFTDDDCIPRKDWIEKMVHELEHSPIVAGTIECSASSYLKSCYNVSQFYAYMPGKNSRRIDFIAGANMGFHRTVLDNLRRFQEGRKIASDTEIVLRARKEGYRISFSPKAIVFHDPVQMNLTQILKQSSRHGAASILLRNQFKSILKTPYILRSPFLIIFMMPIISLGVLMKIYFSNSKLLRRCQTAPIVYLMKIFWCWGAAFELYTSKIEKT